MNKQDFIDWLLKQEEEAEDEGVVMQFDLQVQKQFTEEEAEVVLAILNDEDFMKKLVFDLGEKFGLGVKLKVGVLVPKDE